MSFLRNKGIYLIPLMITSFLWEKQNCQWWWWLLFSGRKEEQRYEQEIQDMCSLPWDVLGRFFNAFWQRQGGVSCPPGQHDEHNVKLLIMEVPERIRNCTLKVLPVYFDHCPLSAEQPLQHLYELKQGSFSQILIASQMYLFCLWHLLHDWKFV